MKYSILLFSGILASCMFFACESENIEDKYLNKVPNDSIPNGDSNSSEILWLPLNGNLDDSTGNNTPLVLAGNIKYVKGINKDHGKGIYLDGSSYLMINLGYYDTLAASFWIKGDGELAESNDPVIFDYGLNALTAQLDATTGATAVNLKKNDTQTSSADNSSVEYLNSFYQYSFVYIEAGGDKTRIYFKGYTSGGSELVYNGELNIPGIIETKSDVVYIGRSSQRENQASSFFKGAIDEIHIYRKPLSNSEIQKMASIQTN